MSGRIKAALIGAREYTRSWVDLIDDHLQAFLFLLLCFGLVISSLLMWFKVIESGDWALVTTGLFGSNAIGGGINQIARSRTASTTPSPEDDGTQKPVL